MFVDSHCHLDCIDLAEFDGDFATLINKTTAAGVEHMLCVSIDMEKYPGMLAQVENYDQISVSVGVHPMAAQDQLLDENQLKRLAAHKKVVAIGETGLDYYYHKGDVTWQQERFRSHIRCANELGKPVIVHTRDASKDTLDILKQERADQCGGVIHCFTESRAFAEKAIELGFMISFSGITTFGNASALRDVARYVPDECLLIETDAPYLAPMPHRGKQNWPGLVSYVAETLAQVRNTTVAHIADITRDNYYRVFSENG